MDWVILIAALQIIAVTTRSIENAPCSRAQKSRLSLNQTKDINHSSGDMEELISSYGDNCTIEIDSEASDDHESDEIIENGDELITNDDALAYYDEDNIDSVKNNNLKSEKADKVDKTFSQRNIIKESNSRNVSGYLSSDDIRRDMRRSNNERSKNNAKTDSKIYVFKDTLHPVYQIKRVDRNDLRSIKFNKTPKITILRRKTNNKHVNKIDEETSSQNKHNDKNDTEVRKNLLDHLLEYFLKIMQEEKYKEIANRENMNDENKLSNHSDSRILDNDVSFKSHSASDGSYYSLSDKEINNTTNTSENDDHVEDNYYDDVKQYNNTQENSISDINNNDSITVSYTDLPLLDVDNKDTEIINVTETTDIWTSSDDMSLTEDINSNKTNDETANNTKTNNKINIDLNMKNINILLENIDYRNGTTIDIDIPLNMTEGPLIISTNTAQNENEISDLNYTTMTTISEDFSEIYNTEEEERTKIENEYNVEDMETTGQSRFALNDDDEDYDQEQTRRILPGRLDKNKSKKHGRGGNANEHMEVNQKCDKRLKMHIDINVF